MILSQQEFKRRERALSHLSNNQLNHGSGSTTHQGATGRHHLINMDFESQPFSPAVMREEMKESSDTSKINMPPGAISPLGDSASDNDNGYQQEELAGENVEKTKQIDDVYDLNAVKPQYELECLRKNWIIDYTKIMEMIE